MQIGIQLYYHLMVDLERHFMNVIISVIIILIVYGFISKNQMVLAVEQQQDVLEMQIGLEVLAIVHQAILKNQVQSKTNVLILKQQVEIKPKLMLAKL
jgi:hypothetical protein